jgi:hypothetical protein
MGRPRQLARWWSSSLQARWQGRSPWHFLFWMMLNSPLNSVRVWWVIPISFAICETLSIFWLRADRAFYCFVFLCSNMFSSRLTLRLASSLWVLILLSMDLTAGLLERLLGLEVVVLVLLALLLPMLSGVNWSSGSLVATSSELAASKSIGQLSPATNEVDPSTVLPVNILSIWSRYTGRPFLNLIKSACPCKPHHLVRIGELSKCWKPKKDK